MIMKQLLSIERDKSLTKQTTPTFKMVVKERVSRHNMQFTVDWGAEPGPWIAFGLNDTVYAAGYLPAGQKPKATKAKSLQLVPPEKTV